MTDEEVIAILDDFWRLSQRDDMVIRIAGQIQDVVQHHRERLGRERYGWTTPIETPYEAAYIPTEGGEDAAGR